MLLLIVFALVVGSALGIFLGLLLSMLFALGLSLLDHSPSWKQFALRGIIPIILRSALAATFTFKLAFHGVFNLVVSGSGPAIAFTAARYFASWAALVAFLVGVNMLRLIPLFVQRRSAD